MSPRPTFIANRRDFLSSSIEDCGEEGGGGASDDMDERLALSSALKLSHSYKKEIIFQSSERPKEMFKKANLCKIIFIQGTEEVYFVVICLACRYGVAWRSRSPWLTSKVTEGGSMGKSTMGRRGDRQVGLVPTPERFRPSSLSNDALGRALPTSGGLRGRCTKGFDNRIRFEKGWLWRRVLWRRIIRWDGYI